MKNWDWWAISLIAAIVCAFVLWYAVTQQKDIGDYSTLVQAIFTIILVFATVASISRADTQIDKSQQQIDQVLRNEVNHALILALQPDNDISISNLSKYAMLIRAVSIQQNSTKPISFLLNNNVLQAGAQLKPNAQGFFSASLMHDIGEYAYHLMTPGLSRGVPNPLKDVEIQVSYSYGGTGSRIYHKTYQMGFDVNSDYIRATGQVWMIWLELKSFHYDQPMFHGSGKVDVPLEDEWNIPQPPDEAESERARQRFMRRHELLARLLPWRRS